MRLELDISDIRQILSMALDEDKDKTLAYIKKNLASRWKKPCGRIECRYSRSVTSPVRWIALNKVFVSLDLCDKYFFFVMPELRRKINWVTQPLQINRRLF
jgi:hypothetical protein